MNNIDIIENLHECTQIEEDLIGWEKQEMIENVFFEKFGFHVDYSELIITLDSFSRTVECYYIPNDLRFTVNMEPFFMAA